MSNLRQAAQDALDLLQWIRENFPVGGNIKISPVLTDKLRAALAEQERQDSYELQQQAWTIDNKYASLLALTLECMILDPERWHDDAVRVLDEYRSEWNKLNPSPSPFGKD